MSVSLIAPGTWSFHIALQRETAGDVVGREEIRERDLVDIVSEAWLYGCLRRGERELSLDDLEFRFQPIHREGQAVRADGFSVRPIARNGGLQGDEGAPGAFEAFAFGRTSLEHVAQRGADRLVAAGALEASEPFYYDLLAESSDDAPWPREEDVSGAVVAAASGPRRAALATSSIPLDALLASAVPVCEPRDDELRVFYVEEALAAAEGFSRQGEREDPPVESGCVLVGELASCPETGEVFAVVTDALEATDAEAKTFSLAFTGETWKRIDAVVRARARREPSFRILGAAHGHPFLPLGGPPCAICHEQEHCDRTTARLSAEDRSWSRAVFQGQPWQVSQVFGLNARNEPVDAFHGLWGGSLVQRGFHKISLTDLETLRITR